MGLSISDIINCGVCRYYGDEGFGEQGCRNKSPYIQRQFAMNGVSYALQCKDFSNDRLPLKREMDNKRALRFILAGMSEFMVESGKTGKQFTYKLDKKSNDEGDIYWVNVDGSDGTRQYAGMVYLDKETDMFQFAKGKKGTLRATDIQIVSLLWILNNLRSGKFNINVKIYHFNKCGACSNKLNTDREMESGICDECEKYFRTLR